MFAKQGKVRLRMVKGRDKAGHLPAGGCVTGLASLLERSLVRIAVAGTALRKRDASVARLPIRPRSVALFAGDILMQTGQRKTRLRVIKAMRVDPRALPVRGGMALRAVCAEPALMLVLVASDAVRR